MDDKQLNKELLAAWLTFNGLLLLGMLLW